MSKLKTNKSKSKSKNDEFSKIKSLVIKKVVQPIFDPSIKAQVEAFLTYCQKVHFGASLPFPDISLEALCLGKSMWENRRRNLRDSIAHDLEALKEETSSDVLGKTSNWVCLFQKGQIFWREFVDHNIVMDRIRHYNGLTSSHPIDLTKPFEDLVYAPLLGWADNNEDKLKLTPPNVFPNIVINTQKSANSALHNIIFYEFRSILTFLIFFLYGFIAALSPKLFLLAASISIVGIASGELYERYKQGTL